MQPEMQLGWRSAERLSDLDVAVAIAEDTTWDAGPDQQPGLAQAAPRPATGDGWLESAGGQAGTRSE
jgi:hypothetical protein